MGIIGRWVAGFGLLVGLFVAQGVAQARPGDVDPDFGTGGKAEISLAATPLPDGRILLYGPDTSVLPTRLSLKRLDASGRTDASFGTGGSLTVTLPTDVELEGRPIVMADGSALIPVSQVQSAGAAAAHLNALVRLLPDGSLDTTFGTVVLPESIHTTAAGKSDFERRIGGVLRLADGRLLVLEVQKDLSGTDCCVWFTYAPKFLVRLLADGRLDTSFGVNGRIGVGDLGSSDQGGPQDAQLLSLRADGSVLIACRSGSVRVFSAEGSPLHAYAPPTTAADQYGFGFALRPDGGLLVYGTAELRRLTPSLQLDATFGTGGVVALSIAERLTGRKDLTQSLPVANGVLRAPSGALYLMFRIGSGDTGVEYDCTGFARLAPDGSWDPTFGQQGISCVMPVWTTDAQVWIQEQSGDLLLSTSRDSTRSDLVRVITTNRPSPGIVSLPSRPVLVNESAGSVAIRVARTAGTDGRVSVRYRTLAAPVHAATASSDYVPLDGTLEWADGDSADKTITLTILQDSAVESTESVLVGLESVTGAVMLDASTKAVDIKDDDQPAPPPAPTGGTGSTGSTVTTPTVSGGSGGGGALTWPWLAALVGLLLVRRRPLPDLRLH